LDWLSNLLDITPVSGRVDIRCAYGAPWRVDFDPLAVGEIPYHVVLRGSAVISAGPFISWTIPLLGIKGTAIFLGTAEWTFGTLLLLGFWNKKLGMLGALGSIATFISTLTILPFVPNGWDLGAGGFPAMAMNAAFLLKDLVLLVVSVYLLSQDARRVLARAEAAA